MDIESKTYLELFPVKLEKEDSDNEVWNLAAGNDIDIAEEDIFGEIKEEKFDILSFNAKEIEKKENESENNSSADSSDTCNINSAQTNKIRTTGKDITNTALSKYKNKPNKNEKHNGKICCEICNKLFHDSKTLKRHQLKIHPGKEQSSVTCNECSKRFPNKNRLVIHVKRVHSSDSPLTCSDCSKQFSTKYRLNIHIKFTHSSVLHKCIECDLTFKHKTSLLHHRKKMHTRYQPKTIITFSCDMCGKSFNFKKSMKDHIMYTHLKEKKNHNCDVCGKGFIKLSLLERHRRRHSKERPFACLNCDKGFSRKYLLNGHLETCHVVTKRRKKSKASKTSK